jgi:hypothetical protein
MRRVLAENIKYICTHKPSFLHIIKNVEIDENIDLECGEVEDMRLEIITKL